MWKYLKFGILNWPIVLGSAASFIHGGPWMWFGIAAVFILGVGGELISRDDNSEPAYKNGWIFDWIAYSITFSLIIALICFVWALSSFDVLNIGQIAATYFGYDALAARASNNWIDYLGGSLSMGGILGVQGIVVAHELTHRTEDPVAMFFGRLTFALMFGTNFATEHVHGHHKNLGHNDVDPVTVRRGTGFYTFLTKGAWDQWHHGWEIERKRLKAAGQQTLSMNNAIVRAWIWGGVVMGLVLFATGPISFLWYLLAIAYAKFILEGLNYFSHYGMMRERNMPIGVRHTFSSNNAIGNMILLNLGRHGAHHADGGHYQDYKAYPDMPQSPYGYLVMTVISWVPPLFKYVMAPSLNEWEDKYATPAERAAVLRDNEDSGAAWLIRRRAVHS